MVLPFTVTVWGTDLSAGKGSGVLLASGALLSLLAAGASFGASCCGWARAGSAANNRQAARARKVMVPTVTAPIRPKKPSWGERAFVVSRHSARGELIAGVEIGARLHQQPHHANGNEKADD